MTGSPRSSARQIRPRRYSSPDRNPRSSVSDSSSSKRLLGLLVLDQLDRLEVAGAADVADDREVAQRLEHRAERRPRSRGRARGPSCSKASRLARATAAQTGCPANVKPCMKLLVALQERLGDAVGGDHRAHRRVRAGEALGGRDDVGLVVVALGAEPLAQAAPGADHLVGDQQHVVLVADLAHALEVALGRGEAAAGVLDGLEDHRATVSGPSNSIRSAIDSASVLGSKPGGSR